MESITLTPEPLIITSDFNIHVNNTNDSDACEFLELVASRGLKQHVIGPTHEGGHTLDLVITRQYDKLAAIITPIISSKTVLISENCLMLQSPCCVTPTLHRFLVLTLFSLPTILEISLHRRLII